MSSFSRYIADSYASHTKKVEQVYISFWMQFAIWLFLHSLAIFLIILSQDIKLSREGNPDDTVKSEEISLRATTANKDEDNKRKIDKHTRLSEKNSEGKGALTKRKGANALSPFFEFQDPVVQQSRDGKAKTRGEKVESVKAKNREEKRQKEKETSADQIEKMLSADKSHFNLQIVDSVTMLDRRFLANPDQDISSRASLFKIPEHYRFQREFALNLSNDNRSFSFNTIRYKDYEYFEKMKRKIAYNWRRNAPTGAFFLGDVNHHVYYPGMNRIITIKNGTARLAFLINRDGKVLDIKVLQRHPSDILTQSCYKAIEDSKGFGPLPDSIKEETMIIPFAFIYRNY